MKLSSITVIILLTPELPTDKLVSGKYATAISPGLSKSGLIGSIEVLSAVTLPTNSWPVVPIALAGHSSNRVILNPYPLVRPPKLNTSSPPVTVLPFIIKSFGIVISFFSLVFRQYRLF